ncbi:MAG: hypothetical protein LBE06_02375 [Azoarcus sp.]|nr:hypothetical protein [Azoarcus sp.]
MTMPLPPKRYFFVVNPVCFHSRREMDSVIEGIHRFFREQDAEAQASPEYAVHISRFPRDAIGAIRRFAGAASPGVPLRVFAVGGDGILFDCLNGVVGLPNAELGTMPYGTEDSFYRVFGQKDKKLFHSLNAQINAPSIPMDALYCGSNYALSYCLVGLESLTNISSMVLKSHHGFLWRHMPDFLVRWLSASIIARRALAKQNYRIWVDGEDWGGSRAIINIANTPMYSGDKTIIPEASSSDGWLDVLCSGDTSVLNTFKMVSYYVHGKHAEHPDLFSYQRAKKVFVISDSPLMLDLDGEVFYDKYITVEVKPGVVRIVTPTGATNEVTSGVRP